MLDIKSKLVLKILLKECPNGGYALVDAKDIISSMPSRYRIDSDGLENILIFLERQEMISIKYDDEGLYCVCVLPLGNEALENEGNQKREEKSSRLWLFVVVSSLSSLVAGVLGVLIANILLHH